MDFDVPYGITIRLSGAELAEVRSRVVDALAKQGFGVLTEIDVRATLEKKLGVETTPYLILGACNPQLAHRALQASPPIGLLLPCNVVIAQDGPDVVVSAASPKSMFSIVGESPDLTPIAADAEARLRAALGGLS